MVDLSSMRAGYAWLGHGDSYTECVAVSPLYRPGPDFVVENRRLDAFPRVAYVRGVRAAARFVGRWAGERLVLWGVNPRVGVSLNARGYARCAREAEVLSSQSLFLDFDLEGVVDERRLSSLERVVDGVVSSFVDRGFCRPVVAFSGGRGYHVLAAYPPVSVDDVPDIGERLRVFRSGLEREFRRELSVVEARLDSTVSLSQKVRAYGTSKPGQESTSVFPLVRRVPDVALREYLLSLDLSEPRSGGVRLSLGAEPPSWLPSLLERDVELGRLWRGEGKPATTDTTRSGYDFALVRRALRLGVSDLGDLAAMLAFRPKGGVQAGGKNEEYVRRTIAAALVR